MQKGASFNLDAVKAKIEEAMQTTRAVVAVSTWRAARKGRPPLQSCALTGADHFDPLSRAI